MMETTNKEYANIVFLNEHELPEDFFIWDTDKQFKHLSQWDYGDYSDIIDSEPGGRNDSTHYFRADDNVFILSTNLSFGYASLSIVLEGDTN